MRLSRSAIAAMLLVPILLGASCVSNPTMPSALPAPASPTSPPAATTTTASPPAITLTTTPPAATTTSPTATFPATTAPVTFGNLGNSGALVYANYCFGCHSNMGQAQNGPPLWGDGVTLGAGFGVTFFANNAQAMLDFIRGFMPLADPGRLSRDQYILVTCYILVQANQVAPMDIFDESRLKNIIIK